jgi:hypothetical protein
MYQRLDGSAAILPAVARLREDNKEHLPVKTTVELPGDLWRSAKIRAMDERVDLRTVLIRALEAYLGLAPRDISRRGRSDGR